MIGEVTYDYYEPASVPLRCRQPCAVLAQATGGVLVPEVTGAQAPGCWHPHASAGCSAGP